MSENSGVNTHRIRYGIVWDNIVNYIRFEDDILKFHYYVNLFTKLTLCHL